MNERPGTAPAAVSTVAVSAAEATQAEPAAEENGNRARSASLQVRRASVALQSSFGTLKRSLSTKLLPLKRASTPPVNNIAELVNAEQGLFVLALLNISNGLIEKSLMEAAETDLDRMRLALVQARKCTAAETAYNVGAVLYSEPAYITPALDTTASPLETHDAANEKVSSSPPPLPPRRRQTLLAMGHSRELPGNTHAEECCFLRLCDPALARNGWMYTTMEPCTLRLSGKRSCAQRIVDAGIARVVVGAREPDVFVERCEGVEWLRGQGIEVVVLDGLEWACLAPNLHLLDEANTDRKKKGDTTVLKGISRYNAGKMVAEPEVIKSHASSSSVEM